MKWVSHVAIAAAVAAPFNPAAVPVAALGATAPDWLEWLEEGVLRRRVRHRTHTHYLAVWLLVALFGFLVWDFRGWIAWFGVGACTHWFADALTIQGVPLGWWSDRRVHLFGGRVRTGSGAEFVIAASCVGIAALVVWQSGARGFLPFFYNWGEFYGRGLIDGLEWRSHRFNYL